MIDAVIVGAGPAGAVAATLLARAGARVCLVDRAAFPRKKLCGDTVNPGTLATLGRLGLADVVEARGLRVDGMLVTGEGGVAVAGTYPRGLFGRAITRADLDWALVQEAMKAGAAFEPGVVVRDAILQGARGATTVAGVFLQSKTGTKETAVQAPVTIAADGRHSTLAFALGLARHPAAPRRWAVGAYYEGVDADRLGPLLGEMHLRRGRYIGIAPIPGGLTNVCLVKPSSAGDAEFRNPLSTLSATIAAEPLLAARFGRARAVDPPTLLGPLAVETIAGSFDGLIVTGDASGFIDPMTGDGLRFAIRGGELAAKAALSALERGWRGVHEAHDHERRRAFASKQRFNRMLRALVSSPMAMTAAGTAARIAPGAVRAIIARAGDCDHAG